MAEYRGRDQSLIVRFRCGNEEKTNKYLKGAEENKCRLCGKENKTIEYLIKECKEIEKDEEITRWKGQEDGTRWMRKVREARRRSENRSDGQGSIQRAQTDNNV